jgi:hypothetical protein
MALSWCYIYIYIYIYNLGGAELVGLEPVLGGRDEHKHHDLCVFVLARERACADAMRTVSPFCGER